MIEASQFSIVSFQLSAISFQPPVFSCLLSAFGFDLAG
jgi:hypothetical protein